MPDAGGFAGRRILVVEDDYLIACDLAMSLQDQVAEVIGPAASVAAAMELVRTVPEMDGALLDVKLRGEMVFPVADALLERNVPLVFATGYDQTAIPERYAHLPYCEKPADLASLARALFGGSDASHVPEI